MNKLLEALANLAAIIGIVFACYVLHQMKKAMMPDLPKLHKHKL